MIPSQFVKREIDFLLENCNFTPDEKTLFILRSKDKTLVQCSFDMKLSLDTVSRLSQKVNKKIQKTLQLNK